MADVALGKKVNYQASGSVEPIVVENGLQTVELGFVDDYSKLILTVTTTATGAAVGVYEATLVARS